MTELEVFWAYQIKTLNVKSKFCDPNFCNCFFILFHSSSGSAFEKAKIWSLFWRTLRIQVLLTVFLNLAEKSKAILFCLIFGFSFRWFIIQSFSSIESLTLFFVIGNIFSFFNLKIRNEFFQFSTKNLLAIETFFQPENDFSKF